MNTITKNLPRFVFWSRWLQAPLYVGLIAVLIVYVYEFALGLVIINLLAKAIAMAETTKVI